jgi:hypothetical protein
MGKHKHHIIAAGITTAIGAAIFVSVLRQPGDASGAIDEIRVQVVDRCGDVVLDGSGKPLLYTVHLKPPALDDTVSVGTGSNLAPLAEGQQVAVPIPANPQLVVGTNLRC